MQQLQETPRPAPIRPRARVELTRRVIDIVRAFGTPTRGDPATKTLEGFSEANGGAFWGTVHPDGRLEAVEDRNTADHGLVIWRYWISSDGRTILSVQQTVVDLNLTMDIAAGDESLQAQWETLANAILALAPPPI